jgi:hypothetical protein
VKVNTVTDFVPSGDIPETIVPSEPTAAGCVLRNADIGFAPWCVVCCGRYSQFAATNDTKVA